MPRLTVAQDEYTYLTNPFVNFGFNSAPSGRLMSNMARIVAMRINTEFSARYLPGHILHVFGVL